MGSKLKIAILGLGLEGKSILKYLRKNREYKNSEIIILDKKFDKNYLQNLDAFDIIFRSPGIPYLHPEIQKAKKAGVEINSATNLFFESASPILRRGSGQVIGITGTKGKGTTATLLYKILRAAKKGVFLVGNIGTPSLTLLSKINKESLVIFELSSFQLQDLRQSPLISIILDINPDHLDYHKNFQEYLSAKSAIAKYQNKNDWVVFSKDNHWSNLIANKSSGKKIGISIKDQNPLLTKIRGVIKIPGDHNLQNAYTASIAATKLGMTENTILNTIGKFKGLPYRLQLIKRKPKIYNDSASTNPDATIAGIDAVKPTILIMGGVSKNLIYQKLRSVIKSSNIKETYLYGANRNIIRKTLSNFANIRIFSDLKTVIKKIKSNITADDVVLFSPGSASFDQFKNYQERGCIFNKLIRS